MKSVLTVLFAPAVLCGMLTAQNTPSATEPGASQSPQTTPQPPTQTQATAPRTAPAGTSQAQPPNQLKIAPGSVIPVQIQKTVDAKKAKTGDQVIAMVTMDMKTNTGQVLVPKDTKIIGHVTEAQARNKEQKESQLGIAFDHAVVKGDQMSLPMSIQAIIAPQTNDQQATAGGGGGGAPEAPGGGGGNAPMAGGAGHASTPGAGGGGGSASSSQNYPQGGGGSESQPQTNARPPITGNTQGVIGMRDVQLENAAQAGPQGSVVTSEKNNVKIEKGTMMLLRVTQ
ncbi:MAG TPA: hypothetical protein VGS27_18525 [Candidatus Sulfotelmatobacter sp.]|nr:hypothetical protein [Candidatus Sulfotelmatobacter sp.]